MGDVSNTNHDLNCLRQFLLYILVLYPFPCDYVRPTGLTGESYTMAKVKTLTAHTVLAGLSVRSPRHKLEPSPDHDFLKESSVNWKEGFRGAGSQGRGKECEKLCHL